MGFSNNKPAITVYIPSHNYGKYLREAIESVVRQSFDNWELFIINDNSTDNTAEVMQKYASDPRIKLFHTSGIGLHGICNLALKESSAKYIIRLDGDDVFDENILLVLHNHLERNENLALVFPDYYLMDEYGIIFAEERRNKLYKNNHSLDVPPNGACFLARTEALKAVGGYSDSLQAQDGYYIWTRLLANNFKCTNINLPLFYYRRHNQNLTNTPKRIIEARRQINKDTVILNLEAFRPFIAVIPCRQHYEFCEDLWNKNLNGKPLLAHALDSCCASDIFDHIIVTCDNDKASELVSLYNDPRISFASRKRRETIRSESVTNTLAKLVERFDPNATGTTVIKYVKTPFTSTESMEEAINTLVVNDSDCSMCVEELSDPIFKRDAFGLTPINHSQGVSSDFEKLYRQSNAVVATRNRNIVKGSLTGPRVVNFVTEKKELFLIDSQQDFDIAQIMLQRQAEQLPNIHGPTEVNSLLSLPDTDK
jgi:glycosyltransferase involved in cell wall biosynthesis